MVLKIMSGQLFLFALNMKKKNLILDWNPPDPVRNKSMSSSSRTDYLNNMHT